jgi:hypothetical protein
MKGIVCLYPKYRTHIGWVLEDLDLDGVWLLFLTSKKMAKLVGLGLVKKMPNK